LGITGLWSLDQDHGQTIIWFNHLGSCLGSGSPA